MKEGECECKYLACISTGLEYWASLGGGKLMVCQRDVVGGFGEFA